MSAGKTVIIGAGVIGLALAHELRQRGAEVVLLDRGRPGGAASAGNAGWVVPSMSAPVPAPGLTGTSLRWMLRSDSPLYIQPRADLGFARWLLAFWRSCRHAPFERGLRAVAALNTLTMETFDALAAAGVAFEMHRSGILYAGLSNAAVRHAAEDLERLADFGYGPPQILDGAELRALEPHFTAAISAGFLVEQERLVRPESLTAGLVDALERSGVAIKTGAAVRAFAGDNARVHEVRTEHEAVPAEQVVIAAGAWSGVLARILGVELPLEAGKGYSITIDDPDWQLRRPVDLIEARVACSPFDGAARFAGTMELSGINDRLRPGRVTAIRHGAERYFGSLPRGAAERVWVGMRPLTPDGLPLIGALPGWRDVYIATGHAMLGVTLAPATARCLADLMEGRPTAVDLTPFSPARFGG